MFRQIMAYGSASPADVALIDPDFAERQPFLVTTRTHECGSKIESRAANVLTGSVTAGQIQCLLKVAARVVAVTGRAPYTAASVQCETASAQIPLGLGQGKRAVGLCQCILTPPPDGPSHRILCRQTSPAVCVRCRSNAAAADS